MAFDPIQEDCHRLVLEALRRDNIPLTDGPAVERLMEQFTRDPAPLIVHDRDRAGHLIAKVVEAVDSRIPFIPTIPRPRRKRPLPRTCFARPPHSIRPTGMPSAC